MAIETVNGEVVFSLAENEEIIERGMSSFVEVGRALQRVRDSGQYLEAGFQNFEQYCEGRWSFKARYALKQMAAARVVGWLEEAGQLATPPNEATTRPLVNLANDIGRFDGTTNELREPEAAREAVISAWSEVLMRRSGEPIRGHDVRAVVSPSISVNRPGWFELLGMVGDTLVKAGQQLDRVEQTIIAGVERRDEPPHPDLLAKADEYARWADELAARLRGIGDRGPQTEAAA